MSSFTASGRPASRGGLLVALLTMLSLGIQQPAAAQDVDLRSLRNPLQDPRGQSPPEMDHVPSDVRDTAGMFSADAVRAARDALAKIERTIGVPVLIETIETLKGETIDEVAIRLARRSGAQGVFILIARKESKIEVLASRRYTEALPRPARTKVRSAFIEGFRKKNFDDGLREGVAALDAELASARSEGKVPLAEKPASRDESPTRRFLPQSPAASAPGQFEGTREHEPGVAAEPAKGKPLVIRNQVRLTLDGARTIIAAAAEQAASMSLKMNIAVVDEGGHLLSFDRMDGARPASGYTAITKASTAATFRQPTGPLPAGTSAPDPLLNLSLQIAAQSSGGKLTTLLGGLPIVVDSQVIGGVGVGGGSGEQDAQVARAGVQTFLDELQKREPR
ncbi:MAG: heme-binding protein [Isosphaeraceae bacterium]